MQPYLTSLQYDSIPSLAPDVVVIGSGIAGLAAALAAAETRKVLLIAKSNLEDTATSKAQGGIAAALAEADTEGHLADTLRAGAGLCDEAMVELLVTEGIARVRELIDHQVPFDRSEGNLALTLEGGHTARRVLHGEGDGTGRVIQESLTPLVRNHPQIQVLEDHFVIDLLHAENACSGVLCMDTRYGRPLRILAEAVIVASGGLGQVFRETTNPPVATGDGFAMCFRAGAALRDMEFVQFHPTTLYLAGAPRFLISEAVRGEGGHLLTQHGERFMPEYHERAELAPRDIVSQTILQVLKKTQTSHVLLTLKHLDPALVRTRFPGIGELCRQYGIDITRDPIPVRPAVHYMMGGVQTDEHGRTNIANLYAAGEVACTGVHGANRLASNSLLEGLVFGHRAGCHAAEYGSGRTAPPPQPIPRPIPSGNRVPLDIEDILRSLKGLTWRCLGVYREAQALSEALEMIAFWERYVLREEFSARSGFEVQNMLTTAKIIARAALVRTESRGAHQRSDFPQTDDAHWQHPVILTRNDFPEE